MEGRGWSCFDRGSHRYDILFFFQNSDGHNSCLCFHTLAFLTHRRPRAVSVTNWNCKSVVIKKVADVKREKKNGAPKTPPL